MEFSNASFNFWLFAFSETLLLFTIIPLSVSQTPDAPAAMPPSSDLCNGIFVSYTYVQGVRIPPNDTLNQPYRFESVLTVLNNGRDELKSWRVFVGFRHREILVSASNAVLDDGSSLPAEIGNGTVFVGNPATDLKTAIDTAGDLNQMQAVVKLVGTQFGVAPPGVPLPDNITLVNDGWLCPKPTLQGTNTLQICCNRNTKSTTEIVAGKFPRRQNGDLTIMYDVIRSYSTNYWAQVTIENHNSLGRLDDWKLSFDWRRDEFINAMKGAIPNRIDSSGCISGPQAEFHKTLDFSSVLSCETRPTIVDLPPTKYNDTAVGLIPFCCRNGTLLPKSMDPSRSISAFQMQVYKMPPDVNISVVSPPENWGIKGVQNADYKCKAPVRVSPSEFPDPSGLPSNRTAFASWQVVCNITKPKGANPKCCVSFSAFYNDSVVPCKTCACGCTKTVRTCSTTAPAMLLPPAALLLPFQNRTKLGLAWTGLKHQQVPNPLPCGDNCAVNLNWHLATDYAGGWTARITIFNWGETNIVDWFAAVKMKNANAGFEKAYSFNASMLSVKKVNDTIFMEGLPGLNYLLGQTDGKNRFKDPKVPGMQQSVISFTKKLTPGINVRAGDGFPAKVLFNGEECSLPDVYPKSHGTKTRLSILFSVMSVLVFIVLQQ